MGGQPPTSSSNGDADRALFLAGANVTIEGVENVPRGGCVLVHNASLLDVVLLHRYMHEVAGIGVGAEVFARIAWMAELCERCGVVLFRRGDRDAAEAMLRGVTQQVRAGAKLAMGGEGRLAKEAASSRRR